MPKFLKLKLNQQGIIHLIPLFILLVGIVAGVYLVQQRTNILPFASEETTQPFQSDQNAKPITSETDQIKEIIAKSEFIDQNKILGERTVKIPVEVFEDKNENGIKDEGEAGIPNMPVEGKAVYIEGTTEYSKNSEVQTRKARFFDSKVLINTDKDGMVQFDWVGPGTYTENNSSTTIRVRLAYAIILVGKENWDGSKVEHIAPYGWKSTTGISSKFYVVTETEPSGETILEKAQIPLFGAQKISGLVFYDNNRNGVRDGDELQSDRVVGRVRVLIDATKANNSPWKLYYGESKNDGTYEIDNLPPLSSYRTKVVPICPLTTTTSPVEGLSLGSAGLVNYDFGVIQDDNDPCVTN